MNQTTRISSLYKLFGALFIASLSGVMSAKIKYGYEVKVFPNNPAIRKYVAERVAQISAESIAARGIFTIALSGGSMPTLLSDLSAQSVSWTDWHVFFADERCVPLDHADSNYKACQQSLFESIPIPPEHIYTIDNIDDPDMAAMSYETRLKRVIPGVSFDLVMLGLGPDGHTASLFPGHELVEYRGERAVMPIFDSPKPPSRRITLTLDTLRRSREVIFIAAGEAKAEKVKQILEGFDEHGENEGSSVLPAGLVMSQTNHATWILDAPAASLLSDCTPSDMLVHSNEL